MKGEMRVVRHLFVIEEFLDFIEYVAECNPDETKVAVSQNFSIRTSTTKRAIYDII